MKNPVAKIKKNTASSLIVKYPDLDIQADLNCDIIINEEEARILLNEEDYAVIDFEPLYIGAPRPRTRK